MEVHITPLEPKQLPQPHARPQSTEEQDILTGGMLPSILKQQCGFFPRQGTYFRFGMIGSPVIASQTKRRVCRQEAIRDCLGEDTADRAADVLQALGTQPFLSAGANERPTGRPIKG